MSWVSKESGLDLWQGQEIFSSPQISPEAHPASYPTDTLDVSTSKVMGA
jgi:hypothetical protein